MLPGGTVKPLPVEMTTAMTADLRLLLACARSYRSEEETAALRRLLAEGVDWTAFARKAMNHGLVSLVARTFADCAADLVPAEIMDAFLVNASGTAERNNALFAELTRLVQSLAKNGIKTIPFKGPVTAIKGYGSLGLREFRDLDFLIRDSDLAAALETLQALGYQRQANLTPDQLLMIHRIQGQEIVGNKAIGLVVEPHTRLTSAKLALDIDYTGLWSRAEATSLNGRVMLTMAPEDHLILLATHGGKELWWRINWACDVAAFIEKHPDLDWGTISDRARAQGCLRMVLLAVSLARTFFKASLPADIVAMEQADPALPPMLQRTLALWLRDDAGGPPTAKAVSMDLLRLHDGWRRRLQYVLRTWFLPAPAHIGWVALPRQLSFAYVPLKFVHDGLLLPLWRAYQQMAELTQRGTAAVLRSDLALAVLPASPETQRSLQLRAEAKRSLQADPQAGWAWLRLGDSLMGLKRYNEAIDCYEKGVSFQPDHMFAWRKLRDAKKAAGKTQDVDDAMPEHESADSWALRAGFLASSRRYLEAVDASERALEIEPTHVNAEKIAILSRLFACDWRRREADEARTFAGIQEGVKILASIDLLRMCDLTDADSLAAARVFGTARVRSGKPLWNGERYRHDKIRVAYLSSDFHDHVVGDAIVGCFEHHDKTRFEVTGISFGSHSDSDERRRIVATFDRFIDADAMTDSNTASLLRELEIDIAVDLNGYTGDRRTGILARRPVPVHVNYLGYPGTMGVSFIDYILADKIVVPEGQRVHYAEKVVYLPNSFFPANHTRPIADRIPCRSEEGLPAEGFVFACHNDERKIGPQIFDIWMRLLLKVEGSVLSLRALHPAAISNLRREAAARGVAPERLIFAPRKRTRRAHLARLRLADLFLDTLPYNAHATACDALWVGLPVLTCKGNAFHGRVAASLLQAVGLPELVTTSLAEYEALALALASEPSRLAGIKAKLERNRQTEPLFDTARYTHDLERAYRKMWERQQSGLPPESFGVE